MTQKSKQQKKPCQGVGKAFYVGQRSVQLLIWKFLCNQYLFPFKSKTIAMNLLFSYS